jgi:SAM-dependent methyltransferase
MFINRILLNPFKSIEEKVLHIKEQLVQVENFYKLRGLEVIFIDLETGIATQQSSQRRKSLNELAFLPDNNSRYNDHDWLLHNPAIVISECSQNFNTNHVPQLARILRNNTFDRIHLFSPFISSFDSLIQKYAYTYEEHVVKHNRLLIDSILSRTHGSKIKVANLIIENGNSISPNEYSSLLNFACFFKKIVTHKNFLEIGSGAGFLPIYLSKFAKNSAGIEIDEELFSLNVSNAKINQISNCIFYNGFTWSKDMPELSWDIIFYDLPTVCSYKYDPLGHDSVCSLFADYKFQTLTLILENAHKYLSHSGFLVLGSTFEFDVLNQYQLRTLAFEYGFEISMIKLKEYLSQYKTLEEFENDDILYILKATI